MAQELSVAAILVDDLQARNFARAMGLNVMGTAGVLLLAHQHGLAVDVKSTLDTMRRLGFRLSEKVYQDLLRQVTLPAEPQ